MSDGENTEVPTTEVNVEVAPPAEVPEPPTESTTVVVADTGDAGIHPALAQFMAGQAAINERLLARMDHTETVAVDASIVATNASETIDSAITEVTEIGNQVSATIAENSEPSTPDNDISPKHSEHRWYRKRSHA